MVSAEYPVQKDLPMTIPLQTKFLYGQHFGLNSKEIAITNKYLWSFREFSLPIEINFQVQLMNKECCEFIPIFSKNKIEWNGKNTDCLSWFLATHRDDFTFRTNMFGDFPKGQQF
jgi:hypothetical protein